jgi:phage terminase small subunit
MDQTLFPEMRIKEELGFKPPDKLRKETQDWCDGIVATYEMKPHHLKVLQAAAESWDLYCAARIFLVKHGTTYSDRFGQPCARPEVAVMRDAKLAFVRILRELNLPGDSGGEPGIQRE